MSAYGYVTKMRGACAAVILGIFVFSPSDGAAQVAVTIPSDVLQATLAGCTTQAACAAAIQALVTQLAAANPGVPLSVIVGSVAAAVSSSYNAGAITAPVAQIVLSSAASVASGLGLTQVSNSISLAVASVADGEPVDLDAIADGSASPT
jgi:hypothetical protein